MESKWYLFDLVGIVKIHTAAIEVGSHDPKIDIGRSAGDAQEFASGGNCPFDRFWRQVALLRDF